MQIVCKFGGTSMASGASIRRVASILKAHPGRKVCVVSAPGKIDSGEKITDLLIQYRFDEVMERLQKICADLSLGVGLYQDLKKSLHKRIQKDEIVAFGEYATARILASLTGMLFVDATNVIAFEDKRIQVNPEFLHQKCGVIIPGFYGLDIQTKRIKIFSRGGSDITGAYIAAELDADLYENWTDVSGVYSNDPNLDRSALRHEYLRYHELQTIVDAGANIFHPHAIMPVLEKRIPVMIRNTFSPAEVGTLIF